MNQIKKFSIVIVFICLFLLSFELSHSYGVDERNKMELIDVKPMYFYLLDENMNTTMMNRSVWNMLKDRTKADFLLTLDSVDYYYKPS